MQKSDIRVIWQTHRLDTGSLEEYGRVEENCRGKSDTLVLYDNSWGDFEHPVSCSNTKFALFDSRRSRRNTN